MQYLIIKLSNFVIGCKYDHYQPTFSSIATKYQISVIKTIYHDLTLPVTTSYYLLLCCSRRSWPNNSRQVVEMLKNIPDMTWTPAIDDHHVNMTYDQIHSSFNVKKSFKTLEPFAKKIGAVIQLVRRETRVFDSVRSWRLWSVNNVHSSWIVF
ncbi:Hypothetical_protein [Hexamita inflata]|uniref:Hypothetical_protein n=1 Tax=Hexamita inflata TaxID=28002 RepID=A0AA86V527_9EUKA|nr:Hypothetical protein HINF_LOCUS44703 [Hexamita inflata]